MKKPSNPKTGKKEHNHYRWALTAFVMAVALSGLLSLSSEAILENADLLLALLILLLQETLLLMSSLRRMPLLLLLQRMAALTVSSLRTRSDRHLWTLSR